MGYLALVNKEFLKIKENDVKWSAFSAFVASAIYSLSVIVLQVLKSKYYAIEPKERFENKVRSYNVEMDEKAQGIFYLFIRIIDSK